MATDAVNSSEDAEMAEYDGDKVVTMMDVLQEQQDFEEDANAVLGASDDKNCTYAKGYIKRQAIYACLTCCPDVKSDPTKRAGVCLACSLNCHENHELIELYTKRNFRCDCGNPKFNSHPCQFTPNKTDLNNDNIYNQNFSGIYCICHRPYPDPESTFEDDMIQCIICEDWLHASHLDAVVPANEQYSEMVCKACMEKNEFLHDYSKFAVNVESVDVDILTVNGSASDDSRCNGDLVKDNVSNGKVESNLESEAVANGADVDMLEDKAKNDATSNEVIKTAEDNSTEEKPIDSTNTVQTDEQIDSDANSQPEQILESTKEANKEPKASSDALEEKDNKSENNEIESDVTKDEHNMEADKVENSDETEEKKEQQAINGTKTDSDKADSNKTEEQLMDDIRALTSDNTEEEAKSSTVEENVAEESKTHGSENKEDSNNTEESPVEQNKPESKDPNPVPESSDIEVPDTSQDTSKKEDDAKTDAVMDAIDALLETTTETKDIESNDNEKSSDQEESASKETEDNAETQKQDHVNMSASENKQEDVSEKVETEKSDVEMDENNQNNESKDDEAPTSETKESNDNKTDTSKIESAADDNKEETESPTETVLNGDNSEALNETDNKTKPNDDDTSKTEPSNDSKTDNATEATNENKRKLSTEVLDQNSPKKPKLDSKCIKPKNVKRVHKGATFWPSNFRQKLCTCGECISMYKDLSALFLIDSDDTVSAYESLGKENVDAGASQYEKGLQALSSLDRIQQINALTEYNRMRDKLLDFLKSFKDRKEIVKEEDIKAFFAGMKPKRESDGVYFCR